MDNKNKKIDLAEKEIVMSTIWRQGYDKKKEFEKRIESFIREYYKGKYKISGGVIKENKTLKVSVSALP